MILFHYTCRHSAEKIRATGLLTPNPRTGLLWLTDMPPDEVDRNALGLTSHILSCDRTECAIQIDHPADAIRWGRVRGRFSRTWVDELELAPGAQPIHWWVSTKAYEVAGVVVA